MTKRYFPEKFNVITPIDDGGALLDLGRITGEDTYEYKKRILESSKRISNSSYEGLINGINRELGLVREKILEISPKKQIGGNISHQEISFSGDTLVDSRQYNGTIDGVSVIAVNNEMTFTQHIWEDNELIGMVVAVDSIPYKILSNTSNRLIAEGASFSDLIGVTYSIRVYWTENELIGMACIIGKRRYTVLENTSETIRFNTDLVATDQDSYSIFSNRPRVQITSSRILLYKEYLNEENYQLDHEISLRDKNIQHIDIIDNINSNSKFFTAINLVQDSTRYPAFTIKQQDSNTSRFSVVIPSTRFYKLEDPDIQEGTMKFTETLVFLREVDDIEEAPEGPYYSVNYKQGIVRSKNIPNGRGTVSYVYMTFPFQVESTPAIVTPFVDDDADEFLFARKEKLLYEDQRDRYISSQPKGKMIEYIAELLSVSNQSWGK